MDPKPNTKSLPQEEEQALGSSTSIESNKTEKEEVLISVKSNFNDILIVDTPNLLKLQLDSTNRSSSIINKETNWTGLGWDEFACLPPIIPKGPIAILGLGGGTCAHLMLELWPSLKLEGWEIDGMLIDKAREYLRLSDLEKPTPAGGVLSVHVGDALSPSAVVPGGFAGIVVDLFSDGAILPQLTEVATWLELKNKLMPNGRIMVNCDRDPIEAAIFSAEKNSDPMVSSNREWIPNSTIKALCEAFPGKLSWKKLDPRISKNYLALTGLLPDLDVWSTSVPEQLSSKVKQWKRCGPFE